MVPVSVLVLVLASSPRLAAPGIACADIPVATCRSLEEHLVQQLTARGLKVIAAEDIREVLGQERQKQLLGCTDSGSSCTAELAGALGVDALVRGNVGRVGSAVVVNVRVIDARSAQPLASFSESVRSIDVVPDALERAAAQVAERLGATGASGATTMSPKWWALLPAGVALGAGIGGGVFLANAGASLNELKTITGASSTYDPAAVARRGQTSATVGYALVSVAAAAALGSVAVALFAPSGSPTISLGPTRDGVAFTLQGSWP